MMRRILHQCFEERTETKQSNRGKGLPGIYQDTKYGWIKDLSIISGKGKCNVMEDGKIGEQIFRKNGSSGTNRQNCQLCR